MEWVMHATPLAALPPKDPVPIVLEAGWSPGAGLDECGKSCPPPGFDRWTVQPVASRYTDCGSPRYTYSTVPILLRVVT